MLANEEKRLCTSCFATSARRISWRRIATIVSTRDAGQVQRLADEYVRCQADTVYSDARLDGCVFCSNLPGTRLLRPDEARG